MNDLSSLWQNIIETIKSSVNAPTFKTWFEPIKPISLVKNSLTLSVSSPFAKEWLESRYMNLIVETAQKVISPSLKVKIIIETNVSNKLTASYDDDSDLMQPDNNFKSSSIFFNPKYTFDTFITGSSNRFACSAAQAVSENPGMSYNPLFIYAGVGLGKTHLLHAIGQYVLKFFPNLIVKYVSAEKFLNDFINAIRFKKLFSFKES